MAERFFVRILVAVSLCIALLVVAVAPLPRDLPPPAFGQTSLYRLEVALIVFYGDLLLVTPAFLGLIRGRLPIGISTRGAKFAEEADQSAVVAKAAIKDLEQTTKRLAQEQATANAQIERLKKERDSRWPPVDSRR
jgi:hypothetical protein